MKQKSVFDKYAHEYDLITNAAQRKGYHRKEVQTLIDRFRPTRVLDAGCAAGLTASLFAHQGIAAVGLDRSRSMLKVAKEKYDGQNLPLTFRYGQFEKLPRSLHGKFDLVVCLANAIAGVDTLANLRASMKGFHAVLQPGGVLVLQMLNYSAIIENTPVPIKVTNNDGIVYARYARRQGRRYTLHLVRLDLNAEPIGFEPFCTDFDNFTPDEVHKAIEKAGFKEIKRSGNLLLTSRFSRKSRDLVITARRAKA